MNHNLFRVLIVLYFFPKILWDYIIFLLVWYILITTLLFVSIMYIAREIWTQIELQVQLSFQIYSEYYTYIIINNIINYDQPLLTTIWLIFFVIINVKYVINCFNNISNIIIIVLLKMSQ